MKKKSLMAGALSEAATLKRLRAGIVPELRAHGSGVRFVFKKDGATVSNRVMNSLVKRGLAKSNFLVDTGRRQTLGDVGKAMVRCAGPHLEHPFIWSIAGIDYANGRFALCPMCLRNNERNLVTVMDPTVALRDLEVKP